MSYNKDYNDLDMKHHVYINVNITSCRFMVTNDALLLKDYKNLDMKLRVDINVNIIMGQRTSNFDNLVQNPAYCY